VVALNKWDAGLYVGRFQPVHKGHIHAIKYAFSRVKELVIGIGSAQYSHEMKNPFTAGERFRMIRLALDENRVKRDHYTIIPLQDTRTHSIWVAQVMAYTPKFNVIFTNDSLTSGLFREANFPVENIPYLSRTNYNATSIRNRILEGQPWETYVPKTVVAMIKDLGGVERIRNLAKKDQP
jgi:nicotinamide-nucleotide adenylyltransferase